ncbi:MAG: radical SAM protein [Thermaerobacter sp.]|nr:radical SAM protein [Thermaerobacter sp.]
MSDPLAGLAETAVDELVMEAQRTSRRHFPPEIVFAAPSQKHYDTGVYQNRRKTFMTLSVTGEACALGCEHCGTKVLQGMLTVNTPARFGRVAAALADGGTEGVLVSGGCLDDGSVPLDRFLENIAELKAQGLKVLVHTGIVRPAVAQGLKAAGVDQVLLDIIGDNDTIREVYHLQRTTESYREALAILRDAGLAAVPHVVIGLHFGRLRGEWEALRMISQEGAAQLVLVVLQPLPGTGMAGVPAISGEEVGRILAGSRLLMPRMPISLGCAKPPGAEKRLMERYAVEVGVQSVAYPLPETVRHAESLGMTVRYHEQCCSLI